jgi:hypothetical protein
MMPKLARIKPQFRIHILPVHVGLSWMSKELALRKPAKAFCFKSFAPILDSPGVFPHLLHSLVRTQTMADQRNAAQPMIGSKFIRTSYFLPKGQAMSATKGGTHKKR